MRNKRANHYVKKKTYINKENKTNDFKQKANLDEVLARSRVGPKQGIAISAAKNFQKFLRKASKHWHDLHQFVSDFAV